MPWGLGLKGKNKMAEENERQRLARLEKDNEYLDGVVEAWYEPLYNFEKGTTGYGGVVIEITPNEGRITRASKDIGVAGTSYNHQFKLSWEKENPGSNLIYLLGKMDGFLRGINEGIKEGKR